MKNLLSKKDFKQLKVVNESMDFSNNTGWSESLVGRAVNKLFSFGKTLTDKVVLNNLQKKLENEYFKGVLRAYAKNNKELKKQKDINVSVFYTKKEEAVTNKNSIKPTKYINRVFYFKFEKGFILDDYLLHILPQSETAEVIKENVDIGNLEKEIEKEIDDKDKISTNPFPFIIKNDDNEAKYCVIIYEEKEEPQKSEPVQSEPLAVGQGEKEETLALGQGEKEETLSLGQGDIEVGKVLKYTTKDNKNINVKVLKPVENNKALVQYKTKDGEIKNINVEVNKLSKIQNKEENQELKKQKKEANSVYTKLINRTDLNDEQIKKLKRAKKIIDSHLTYGGDESKWIAFKNIIKSIDSSISFNESKYSNFLLEKKFKELDNFVNELKLNTEGLKQIKNVVVDKLSRDEQKKLGLNKSQSLKQLFGSDKLKENDKELINVYGDIKLNEINPDAITKEFIDNEDLRKLATSLVNKEAIKEIALRAQWMYDDEKYKDKRSEHYTRLNFTTTGGDMRKLENNWLKKISKVKSEYVPFFGDPFPQELDPIALINSDKGFREKWNQYSSLEADEKSDFDPSNLPSNTIPKGLVDVGKLKDSAASPGNYGIFILNTKPMVDKSRKIGMLYQHLELDKYQHCYKFLGLIDWQELEKEEKIEKGNEKEIKELIKKHHYTSRKYDETTIIGNAPDQFKEIYNAFRINKKLLSNNSKKNVTSKNSAVAYYYGSNVVTGSKKMVQLILLSDDWNNDNFEVWIPSIKNKIIKAYFNIVNLTKKSDSHFEFVINKSVSISSTSINTWGIKEYEDDNKKNEKLKSKKVFDYLKKYSTFWK